MKFILLVTLVSILSSCSSMRNGDDVVPAWTTTCKTNWNDLKADKLSCDQPWIENGKIYAMAITVIETKGKGPDYANLKESNDKKAKSLLSGTDSGVTVEDNFRMSQMDETLVYKTKYYSLVSIPLDSKVSIPLDSK